MPFVVKRKQFPVRLCFAMTINKAQGQTIEKLGLYLPTPVFTHGQLYVAVSRVKKKEDLKILILDPSNFESFITKMIHAQFFLALVVDSTSASEAKRAPAASAKLRPQLFESCGLRIEKRC